MWFPLYLFVSKEFNSVYLVGAGTLKTFFISKLEIAMVTVKFVTGINGDKRGLLTAEERAEAGDGLGVFLYLKKAENYTGATSMLVFDDKPPVIFPEDAYQETPSKQQRYSIHSSMNSKTGNLIKHTLELENGKIFEGAHFTEAIKTHDRFAFVYARRTTELFGAHYDVQEDEGDIVISLPDFDPHKYNLCYFVLVSRPDRKIELEEDSFFSYVDHCFANFRVSILYTFLKIPSYKRGHLFHCITFNPKDFEDTTTQEMLKTLSEGVMPENVITFATNRVKELIQECIETACRMDLEDKGRDIPLIAFLMGENYIQLVSKIGKNS
ncbi:MAG: hypothetical protein GC136_09470 [Alphaproteobacteria bacterium]|nr:hypothetical protein [Alphaproteobacteria bacterium]